MTHDHELENFLKAKNFDDTATITSNDGGPIKVHVKYHTLKRNLGLFCPTDTLDAVLAYNPDATVHEVAVYAIENYPETVNCPDLGNFVVFHEKNLVVDMSARFGDIFGQDDTIVISNNTKVYDIAEDRKKKSALIVIGLCMFAFFLMGVLGELSK